MDVLHPQIDHHTVRVLRRAADFRMFAEAQPHLAPFEGHEMWAYGMGCEAQRLPVKGHKPFQVVRPDDDANDSFDHVKSSDVWVRKHQRIKASRHQVAHARTPFLDASVPL